MQIVIDIDDMAYKFVQDTSFVEDESTMFKQTNADRKKTLLLFDILNAIKNGTPLPKGHGNLIQREEAEAIFRNAKMALYKQSHTEQIKDFQTRELMLLNAEQFVHLIKPIIEADKAESEDKE